MHCYRLLYSWGEKQLVYKQHAAYKCSNKSVRCVLVKRGLEEGEMNFALSFAGICKKILLLPPGSTYKQNCCYANYIIQCVMNIFFWLCRCLGLSIPPPALNA